MAQRRHLDDFLRGRIIGRLECGRTQLEVSEVLGIAQSVLSRLWQRFQDDGNVSRCYSTGRPRVTTPNEDRYLAVTAKRNRRSTASDLSRQLSSATGLVCSLILAGLVWKAPGTRYHQENTIERHRYGGAGWLVWGGIVAAVAEWYRYRTVACFVTGSNPVPLKTRRVGQRCTLNLSRAETSSRWCGVVRRGGCQLRCRPRHLTMVQNYVVRRQKPSCS
ncbi:uncharacterized protein TNCV_1136421 [Trichonephila clavipes]|nr:uncharacterized protein TNCV_1136421 [Trichonephila clavipes]